jgi:hypothetical protein
VFSHKLKVVLLINDTETYVETCVSFKLSKLLKLFVGGSTSFTWTSSPPSLSMVGLLLFSNPLATSVRVAPFHHYSMSFVLRRWLVPSLPRPTSKV